MSWVSRSLVSTISSPQVNSGLKRKESRGTRTDRDPQGCSFDPYESPVPAKKKNPPPPNVHPSDDKSTAPRGGGGWTYSDPDPLDTSRKVGDLEPEPEGTPRDATVSPPLGPPDRAEVSGGPLGPLPRPETAAPASQRAEDLCRHPDPFGRPALHVSSSSV